MKERQQAVTTYPLPFLLVSSSDHVTPVTGATVTVVLSKNSAAFAAAAGTVTEVGNGWYSLGGSGLATDLDTLGPLVLHATATGADPTDSLFTVVPWNPFDGVRMGMTALPNAAAAASGGLLTYGTSTGQINPSSGKIPATLASTDVTGNVAADVQTIKTQTVTCAAGVTVGAYVGNATAALAVDASGRVDVGKLLGAASQGAAGYVGIDWSKVTNPASTVGLTGTTISTTQVVASVTTKTGYGLASDGLDAITVETGVNARQALAINAAALAGVLAGAAGTTVTIAAANNSGTNRITATVDSNGNRSAVTLNLPA